MNKRKYLERNYLSYNRARAYAKKLGLTDQLQWFKLSREGKVPDNIPGAPYQYYKIRGTWVSWPDFLGYKKYGKHASKPWPAFKVARAKARKLNVKSARTWGQLSKDKELPECLPATPDKVYKDEWKGWSDWLGTKPWNSRSKTKK